MKNPNNKTLGERSQDKERSPDKERCQDKERSEDREKSEDKRRSGDIERSADRERSREQGVILSLSNSYRSLQYYNINYSEQIYVPVSVPVYYGVSIYISIIKENFSTILNCIIRTSHGIQELLDLEYSISKDQDSTLQFPAQGYIPSTIYIFRNVNPNMLWIWIYIDAHNISNAVSYNEKS